MKNGIDLIRDLFSMGTGRVISYMSHQHLLAAEQFSEVAKEEEGGIEEYNPLSPPHKHRTYIVGAIVMSVAAIEAFINELFADAEQGLRTNLEGLDQDSISLLGSLWRCESLNTDRRSIVDKYLIVMEVGLSKSPARFKGSAAYFNAKGPRRNYSLFSVGADGVVPLG